MAGTKILATERNAAMTAIDNARAKWGLTKVSNNATVGTTKTTVSDYNNLITWLTQAKTASNGSTTSVEGNITAGTLLYQTKITNLVTQANAIYNYCKCHGNCSGSCTGSCTGGCSGGCSGSCGQDCGRSSSSGGCGGCSGH